MTKNQIEYQKHLEQTRANIARESETNRANLAGEQLRGQELAETSRHNVVTEGETERSNRTKEAEAQRSNLAKEAETYRKNTASEAIAKQQVALGYSTLAETESHNAATEQVQKYAALEQHRSNLAQELETNRANQARETETTRDNLQKRENEVKLEKIRQEGMNSRLSKELTHKYVDTAVHGVGGLVNSLSRLFGGK